MKIIINGLRHLRGYTFDGLQIRDTGPAHRLGGAKMLEQGAFASRADTRHVVKRCRANCFPAFGPVGADGEAMRFVAQPLDEIECRVTRLQHEIATAADEEAFAPRIAVRTLCNTDDTKSVDAELVRIDGHCR